MHEARVGATVSQQPTQFHHGVVDGAVVDVGVDAPDLADQLFLAQDPTLLAGQDV
jgi:hypothetical protein